MSQLIVPSKKTEGPGPLLTITPETANWQYVGFEVHRLAKGHVLQRETGSQEICLVLLSGIADVTTASERFSRIGERRSVFDKIPPYSVYLPNGEQFTVTAHTDLEIALCSAPGYGNHPVRLIKPEHVGIETRGAGHMQRQIHNILPEQQPADSLLVVEVLTPEGHWSSYPPHKHDQENLPLESYLEETYYHKVSPDQGFVIQRVYTDDRSLDETMTLSDGDAVMVPKGYHPVTVPPGYESYYLNVMAGPVRTWKFHNDPDHDWLFERFPKSNKE